MASAQPAPAFTSMAFAGQFKAQAPHSMHKSFCAMRTFSLCGSNTPWGQTSMHLPHPIHFSSAKESVATFAKY